MTQRRRKQHNEHPASPRRRRRAARVHSGVGARIVTTLAVVAAVIFGVAIFFRVHTVEVRGNSVYGADAVIAASGVETGDSLLAISKASVAGKIMAALPYVESVRIGRSLPDTLVLEVTESDAVFSVQSDAGETWLMNFAGKILEKSPADGAAHPAVTGFTVTNPTVGEQAVSASAENLAAALAVLAQTEGTGLADKLTKVDASKPYDLEIWYTDQFEVRLGGTDQMDYKIKYLLAVLDQLSEYQAGTIDLTFDEEKVARFIPW